MDPMNWFSLYKSFEPGGEDYYRKGKTKQWEPPPLIKNKFAKNILITLALGAGGALVTMSPAGAVYFMVHGAIVLALKDRHFKHEIKRLEKKGYVALTKTEQGFAVKLLKKANRRLKGILFEDIVLPRVKLWDGKWRFFIFDIPEKYRSARDTLRQKLKDLGMYNIQRSVYVYPHDCRKELEFLSDYYGITKYATYVETSFTDIDKELRKCLKPFLKG